MTPRLIIEVRGGSIECISSTEDLEIIILDHNEDPEDLKRNSKYLYHPDWIGDLLELDKILKEALED
jgi:hypothetical protein